MDDLTRWLDHLDALTAATPHGPWAWRGRYPQMIINPGAALVAETHADPDHPAHVADWICAARTALPALTSALRAVIDLHQPTTCVPRWCVYCCIGLDATVPWPCPTYEAITARLVADTDMRVADAQRLLVLADALDLVPVPGGGDSDEAKLLADAAALLRYLAQEASRG